MEVLGKVYYVDKEGEGGQYRCMYDIQYSKLQEDVECYTFIMYLSLVLGPRHTTYHTISDILLESIVV